MSWFRANRRRLSLFSALVLALQTLAVTMAASANAAAASAEGSNLVLICTANGAQMIDLSNPDSTPTPATGEHHQCPLCIVGCANCGTPAVDPALLLVTVVAMMVPPGTVAVPDAAAPQHPPARFAVDASSPRGPPKALV